jgi:hypothetical protein
VEPGLDCVKVVLEFQGSCGWVTVHARIAVSSAKVPVVVFLWSALKGNIPPGGGGLE